jgi:hypothetical protein
MVMLLKFFALLPLIKVIALQVQARLRIKSMLKSSFGI